MSGRVRSVRKNTASVQTGWGDKVSISERAGEHYHGQPAAVKFKTMNHVPVTSQCPFKLSNVSTDNQLIESHCVNRAEHSESSVADRELEVTTAYCTICSKCKMDFFLSTCAKKKSFPHWLWHQGDDDLKSYPHEVKCQQWQSRSVNKVQRSDTRVQCLHHDNKTFD